MLIERLSTNGTLGLTANYSTNGYPTVVPQNAVPTLTSGAFDLSWRQGVPGLFTQNSVIVVPFGVGSSASTFSMRVIGWRHLPYPNAPGPGTAGYDLWIPVNLLEVTCSLNSASPGVATTLIPATSYFCDTIVVVTGSTAARLQVENINSPANGTIAHFAVDLKGSQKMQFVFTTGGSATSCNCVWALE